MLYVIGSYYHCIRWTFLQNTLYFPTFHKVNLMYVCTYCSESMCFTKYSAECTVSYFLIRCTFVPTHRSEQMWTGEPPSSSSSLRRLASRLAGLQVVKKQTEPARKVDLGYLGKETGYPLMASQRRCPQNPTNMNSLFITSLCCVVLCVGVSFCVYVCPCGCMSWAAMRVRLINCDKKPEDFLRILLVGGVLPVASLPTCPGGSCYLEQRIL